MNAPNNPNANRSGMSLPESVDPDGNREDEAKNNSGSMAISISTAIQFVVVVFVFALVLKAFPFLFLSQDSMAFADLLMISFKINAVISISNAFSSMVYRYCRLM